MDKAMTAVELDNSVLESVYNKSSSRDDFVRRHSLQSHSRAEAHHIPKVLRCMIHILLIAGASLSM